jgi:hypothetical protein
MLTSSYLPSSPGEIPLLCVSIEYSATVVGASTQRKFIIVSLTKLVTSTQTILIFREILSCDRK